MRIWDCSCGARNAPSALTCSQCGADSPTRAYVPQAPPKDPVKSANLGALIIGLVIPVGGAVYGLIRAFDPERRQEAGYAFGGAVTGIFLWIWLYSLVPSQTAPWQFTPQATANPLTVSNVTTDATGYVEYIVGRVTNSGAHPLSIVTVTFNLYAADGVTQVGSTSDMVNNLQPRSTWEFRAPMLEPRAKRYRLSGVNGL